MTWILRIYFARTEHHGKGGKGDEAGRDNNVIPERRHLNPPSGPPRERGWLEMRYLGAQGVTHLP